MKINIADSKGNRIFIDIADPHIKVKELKKKIFEKNVVKTPEIMLHLYGEFLEDDSFLEDYDLEDGDLLIYCGVFVEK